MQDETDRPRVQAEVRRRIRPKYKGMVVTWKRLFIGAIVTAGILAYFLMMALMGGR